MGSLLKNKRNLVGWIRAAYYAVRWSIVFPRIYTNVVKHGLTFWVDDRETRGRKEWKKIKSRINIL